MENDREQECVRRARAGDRAAFAALVERYWHPVRAWLAGLIYQSRSTLHSFATRVSSVASPQRVKRPVPDEYYATVLP